MRVEARADIIDGKLTVVKLDIQGDGFSEHVSVPMAELPDLIKKLQSFLPVEAIGTPVLPVSEPGIFGRLFGGKGK